MEPGAIKTITTPGMLNDGMEKKSLSSINSCSVVHTSTINLAKCF